MDILATRLKELRNEKGFTLEKIANDLDTSKISLSRYENGTRDPKSSTLNKLAEYFNVSTDYLLGKTDDRLSVSNTNIAEITDEITGFANRLKNIEGLMCYGEPMDEEALSRLLDTIELGLDLAKKKQAERSREK